MSWYEKNIELLAHVSKWLPERYPSVKVEILPERTSITPNFSLPHESVVASGFWEIAPPSGNERLGYQLAMVFPEHFPNEAPIVVCTDENLPTHIDRHIMPNQRACLGTSQDIYDRYAPNPTIENFCENILEPFIAWQLYYAQHGKAPPWGERSHGLAGEIEAFTDKIVEQLRCPRERIFQWIVKHKPKKHQSCPCGSQRQFRFCHAKTLRSINAVRKYYRDTIRMCMALEKHGAIPVKV